jgi:translation elongation factor EF-Ts
MKIDPKTVMELREKTGAGVMDCKKALAETEGELEKAIVWLREKGIAAAASRASRTASEGSVGTYIHAGGKLGVLIEVNCETDFCAKSEAFQALVRELAMQVAAANPVCVKREDVPAAVIEQERQIYASQAEGKPARSKNSSRNHVCSSRLIFAIRTRASATCSPRRACRCARKSTSAASSDSSWVPKQLHRSAGTGTDVVDSRSWGL